MAIAFKHRYKSSSLIGTGTIKFRRYSITPPLSISYALTNCTADSTNPTEIVKGKTYDFGFTANSGYEFPSSGTTSVSGGTIVVWDYPDASDLTKITVAIEVTGNLTITQIASVALPQLATPANVSADGTTVSWDEIENATSYAVLADGSEIGTVEKETGFVQIFPTTTSNGYTLFENLNQSKVYTILLDSSQNVKTFEYSGREWRASGITIVSQTSNSVEAIIINSGDTYLASYENGKTLEGDTKATISDFDGFDSHKVYSWWKCFVEGTKITLSDGSTKLVQDIQYGDKVLCYDFTNGAQTISYIDWMIPERIATKYWEITLSDGTILNLVGSNGKSHRLYNITKQRFDYPQDFEPSDLTLKEDGTTAYVLSCREIEKEVRFYNIASHEHINVYANGVLTSNRLNNRFRIVDNKFTAEKVMTDEEVSNYCNYLDAIRAK